MFRHPDVVCLGSAMGSALLFIVRSRLLVYSAGSGVNRVQVVLSGFSMRLFCVVQTKTACRYSSSGFFWLFNWLLVSLVTRSDTT